MRLSTLAAVVSLTALAQCQMYYDTTMGAMPRPQCTTAKAARCTPQYSHTSFSFTLRESLRHATSVPPPASTLFYAPPYSAASYLVPNLSTTTWGSWNPTDKATATDSADPYGTVAWSALWNAANISNFTTGIYSTTVQATPIPTSELVLPPADYFGPTDCYNFPDGFVFGVAGSAAQIEGAVAMEGKTPSLMEVFIDDDRPRDFVTNENYYLYRQDVERLASMGVKHYSFSIAWNRILPFALPASPVNQQAIDHYDDLIDFVIAKGMVPIAELLHFDTPLQFYGNQSTVHDDVLIGYNNGAYQNETFADAFVHYGKIVLTHFADRVPYWVSYNEPLLYSSNGKSIDTVIKSHARLYHFYKEELRATGKFGIKFNDNFGVPLDPANQSDVFAANWFNDFQLASLCNPIYLGADYPDAFKETIPDYVPLTAEDLAYIGGTADFLGIDPYTATVVTPPSYGIHACAKNTSDQFFPYCVNQSSITANGWNIGYRSQSYVYITPTYLREYLGYLWNTFQAPILIGEFGFPVWDEADKLALQDQLFDTPRSIYYLSYLSETLKAIWEDGVNVMGALAWSFADNWEFGDYSAQFGLQVVNRTTQQRYYKKSFFDVVDFVNARTPSYSMKG